MIQFACDCGKQLRIQDEYAGRNARCPNCGRLQAVPEKRHEVQPAREVRHGPGRPAHAAQHSEEPGPTDQPNRSTRLLWGIVGGVAIVALILTFVAAWALRTHDETSADDSQENPRRGPQARIQESTDRSISNNRLKQLAFAMLNYQDVYGRFPPSVVYDAQGKPLYSWRVLLLPFLEAENLYKVYHLNEAWDSPHNKALLAQMPTIFAPTEGIHTKEPYSTFYQVLDGPGAAFRSGVEMQASRPGLRFLKPFHLDGKPGLMESQFVTRLPASFQDGTSNTILIAEAAEAVPWTKPQDLTFSETGPLPRFGGLRFVDGFNAAMADSSIHFVRYTTSEQTLRAAITASAGDLLGPDW